MAPAREDAPARQRILDVALSMMAQRGVQGTSMRDLASAVGLNVATLYHYFPSKRDLLMAVLGENARPDWLGDAAPTGVEGPHPADLAHLLDEMLNSMLEVEDFIRLMLGEVMRGEELARSVGGELYTSTQVALEQWLVANHPELADDGRAAAMARALRAFLIGVFFEHVAGVLDPGEDTRAAFWQRAREMADALSLRALSADGA